MYNAAYMLCEGVRYLLWIHHSADHSILLLIDRQVTDTEVFIHRSTKLYDNLNPEPARERVSETGDFPPLS